MFIPVHPRDFDCHGCGGRRRFWFNREGLRILRCPNCELEDILAYLRGEYGDESNVQLIANRDARFLRSCGIKPEPVSPH
jgi:hypothetical protein